MTDRQSHILIAIIEQYAEIAAPVGSVMLAKLFGVSSATIRSEMVKLEHMGYIMQPHTSAGRIPTDKGYRYYVNQITEQSYTPELPSLDRSTKFIEARVASNHDRADKMIRSAVDSLVELTHNLGIATIDGQLYMSGIGSLFSQPEFMNGGTAPQSVARLLDNLEPWLREASPDEPLNVYIGEENPIGKATKGAALAVLTKLYMHEKDWDNVISTSQQVIDLNYYSLYDNYKKMFSIEGENNKEYIYRAPCIAQSGYHNNYMPHAFPPNYPIQSNWVNFGAQFRTYTAFYETFLPNDNRTEVLITNYTDQSGEKVELLRNEEGVALDNVRSFKYWPDPDAVGEANGNDIVYIRYADILLCKAEALNEKQGPNQESITLINMIRKRAKTDEISLNDYNSKEALRDFILAERGREFFSEGLRREDLIRHGKFISDAVARGKNAKPFHVLYPIPQRQREANSSLGQNPGYEGAE